VSVSARTISANRILGMLVALGFVSAALAEVTVGRFDTASSDLPSGWQIIQLEKNVPPTQYRLLQWDGVPAVESQADRSMALLGRQIAVDLMATPVLCWRWRVEDVIKKADMRRRQGDDYAARVYIALVLPIRQRYRLPVPFTVIECPMPRSIMSGITAIRSIPGCQTRIPIVRR
jgi:hypothetical protein